MRTVPSNLTTPTNYDPRHPREGVRNWPSVRIYIRDFEISEFQLGILREISGFLLGFRDFTRDHVHPDLRSREPRKNAKYRGPVQFIVQFSITVYTDNTCER